MSSLHQKPVTGNRKPETFMKLWQKNKDSLKQVEEFTVGNDREFDLQLAPFDVLGSIAHAMMLGSVGLISPDENEKLVKELREIYKTIQRIETERLKKMAAQ